MKDEADRELGNRIREMRRDKGITLSEAAKAADVSESFLSQVERGIANPSVASLRRIADALNEPVASLFVGKESEGMLIRAGERRRMAHPRGAYEDFLLTPPTARKLQIIQTVIGPGRGSGDEPYAHNADEECVIVLNGRLDVTVGGTSHRLESGDSLLIDPRQEHSFHNFTEEPTVVLWAMSPSVY
ncbi:helix-turn-helix domain-containing protein [Planosporangium flavigriseum]|uniref:helix-turn-helix domain-containing protein n=1 Tax=Planosporangium flavigriseum TaxID=373681 RepID=UPI001438CC99|nr:XRE family transcriptional regulator [Planosporangium flavigriseum]NJC65855.1 helix-turn-helix domain-containing protein [Planosporangium flavigriseum]